MIKGPFSKYIIIPVMALLKQGLSPQRLALSMASGIVIGTFPIVGTTTAICTMVAILFRLNLLVAQTGNWLVCPFQLILIVPFIILGEHLFNSPLALNPSVVLTLLRADIWQTLQMFSKMILHAAVAWAMCAPPAFMIIYALLNPIFRILHSRMNGGTTG